jgi:nitrate reductase gamma subunit
MRKIFFSFLLVALSVFNSLSAYSQYELTAGAKAGQSIGNFLGKAVGYALLIGIIYLIYKAITKKSEK